MFTQFFNKDNKYWNELIIRKTFSRRFEDF